MNGAPALPSSAPRPAPTPSQRAAIASPAGPALVLAGPGAGKTFCLIERIRFLLEELHLAPARICAFTFTNRAAEEIAERLRREVGAAADLVRRQTIHAFCSELLREFDGEAGLERGFGIADEEYQGALLTKLHLPKTWHSTTLNRFSRARFLDQPLGSRDARLFRQYENELTRRRMVDFDQLVLKASALLTADGATARAVRARFDCVLVDEFQDLNPVQYDIVHALGREHQHIFAVGDDEQSIYSWAGAQPELFARFLNDFHLSTKYPLTENRRSPRGAYALARRLVEVNPPIFQEARIVEAERESPFPVRALSFPSEVEETAWLVDDIRRDRDAHQLRWGEVGVLYRTHDIGAAIEAACLSSGIPCRLAHGRAIADDPVARYVNASLRVIQSPDDPVAKAAFLGVVLPGTLIDNVRARAEERGHDLLQELRAWSRERSKHHEDVRKIQRASYALRNLAALATRHESLAGLVEELLSHRVGEYRSLLEERHDDLTDPAADTAVVQLAERLTRHRATLAPLTVAVSGGAGIAIVGMLRLAGWADVRLAPDDTPGALHLTGTDARPGAEPPLRVFKAVQLMASAGFANAFRDFTAIDTETTGKDVRDAQVIELAAVRVRDGRVAGEYHQLVRPTVRIEAGARAKHGLGEADLAGQPTFDAIWPEFSAFCGRDVLVAHNGHLFDFPILRRQAKGLPGGDRLTTYDALPLARELHPGSRKLEDLAHAFGIDPGQSHRALDDTRTLAHVFLALGEAKVVRARKTAHPELLGHLAIALALTMNDGSSAEERLVRDLAKLVALGKYSDALEQYRTESTGYEVPSIDEVVRGLGGAELQLKLRTDKSADQRYPVAMARLRRLIAVCSEGDLRAQTSRFLEMLSLSRADGSDAARDRVNLLTLHATKGLEFSRVFIVGTSDAELPGGSEKKAPSEKEVQEARRLLYVGMTRTKDRLVLTRAARRAGRDTGGHQFLDEMGLVPEQVHTP